MNSDRRIGIVGAGRVAQALALGLAPHLSSPPRLWTRSAERLAAATARIGVAEAAASLETLAQGCDIIAIAVSDDALAAVAAALADALPTGHAPFVFHVSGGSGAAILAPLLAKGAMTAAVHPAMTFTGDPHGEVARMRGACFAITGANAEAADQARMIVTWLNGITVDIAEHQRPLYHAALCHASNHLVTLIAGASQALGQAGVDNPGALLAPLARAALENALERGMAGLSGPLLRGDARTIGGHLDTIAAQHPALLPAYRAMAGATLDALEPQGTAETRASIRHLLD